MILSWEKEIKEIDPYMKFRSEGGWLKTVEKLDKNVSNDYYLVGDFEENYSEGL